MLESRLHNQPPELVKSLQFMGTGSQPCLWEILKNNRIPLLLLVGENDHKFIEINRKIAKITPLSQLKVINNAAHNIHFENTDKFVQELKRFFTATFI